MTDYRKRQQEARQAPRYLYASLSALLAIVMSVGATAGVPAASEGANQPADHHVERDGEAPEIAGCRLTIKADRESYRFDEPIRLRVMLENVSDRPVRVDLAAACRFEVTTVGRLSIPDAKPAPLTLQGRRLAEQAGREKQVATMGHDGVHITTVPMLNRLYDMSLLREYAVTAYRLVWPDGADAVPVEVRSNTLKIVVHGRKW